MAAGNGIPAQVFMTVWPLPAVPHLGPSPASSTDATSGSEATGAERSEEFENHRITIPADEFEVDRESTDADAETGMVGQHGESAPRSDRKSVSSRDWNKPQFIDFTSPLLFKLFAQIQACAPAVQRRARGATPRIR